MHFLEFKKLYIAFIVIVALLSVGVLGYSLIEEYSFTEALYMTVITVSTVGYSEVSPLSDNGRYFTIFLIVSSFGTFAYAISAITTYVIDGSLVQYLHEYKSRRIVNEMKNHIVICGFGRNGKQAASEFEAHGQDFVVIENDPLIIEELRTQPKMKFLSGDATQDDLLLKAGIESAKAIITTLPNDANNLFIVLSARVLNPKLLIISRASDDNSDLKLRRAGANNVIMPDKIGGAHMASLIIKPDVLEFLDYLMGQGNGKVNLEEIVLKNIKVDLENKTIRELEVRNKLGANIIGLKTETGGYMLNPPPDTKLTSSCKIFVLGTLDQVDSFKKLVIA